MVMRLYLNLILVRGSDSKLQGKQIMMIKGRNMIQQYFRRGIVYQEVVAIGRCLLGWIGIQHVLVVVVLPKQVHLF